jgi:hypothetical protein
MLSKDTPVTTVFFVWDDDGDADTIVDAVVVAADAHHAQVERIKATAAENAAAENEALNDSIAAALAAAVAKTDAAAAAFIAEEEVEACVVRTRHLANKLTTDAKVKVAAQKKTMVLEHKRAVAATESETAQRNLREAADRDAERDRKLREQRKTVVLRVLPVLSVQSVPHVLNVCPIPHAVLLLPRASPSSLRARRPTPTPRSRTDTPSSCPASASCPCPPLLLSSAASPTDVLLFGEFDEDTQHLTSCPEPARCSLCCERRATHMYLPCRHVCVCRDCAAACPWVCMTCDVTPEMVMHVHSMPK